MARVARSERLASRWLETRLMAHGVTFAEFRVVGLLLGETRGLRQTTLQEKLGVSAATISASVNRMEHNGVIVRTPDPDDGRARLVRLAPDVPRISDILDDVDRLEALATEGVSPADLAVARRVLGRVISNLEKS